ncbi:MAG: pseudouridine synthase [Leptospirillia bacterium]
MEERLQKIIARAGIASRREAERLIEDGRVRVNGHVASLGDKADPEVDHIKVGRKQVPKPERKVYFLFYKPRGVITTSAPEEERTTVEQFFAAEKVRVYPVGRLDIETEGLMVVTNDGDLAHALMHPKRGIEKRYLVKTKGIPPERALDLLRRGITLEDGRTAPAEVTLKRTTRTNAWVEIVLREGKNRQVRRMFDQIHHSVVKLRRVAYAFLTPGNLEPGAYRPLTEKEVARLKAMTDEKSASISRPLPSARLPKEPTKSRARAPRAVRGEAPKGKKTNTASGTSKDSTPGKTPGKTKGNSRKGR